MHQDAADDPLIYLLLLHFVLLLLFNLKKNCTLFLCARLEAEPHIVWNGHSNRFQRGQLLLSFYMISQQPSHSTSTTFITHFAQK